MRLIAPDAGLIVVREHTMRRILFVMWTISALALLAPIAYGQGTGFPIPPENPTPFDPHGRQTGFGSDGYKIKARMDLRVEVQREDDENAKKDAESARKREEARIAADPQALRERYAVRIKESVIAKWDGHGATPGMQCRLKLSQLPGGKIQRVDFLECPYDSAVRADLEAALLSNVLPYAGFESVFAREITMAVCFPQQQCK